MAAYRSNVARIIACSLLISVTAAVPSPKDHWKSVAEDTLGSDIPHGRWWAQSGTASDETERLGQVCDTYLRAGDASPSVNVPDLGLGCVSVWVADRGDHFTAVDLPVDERDNFLNTLFYNKAWLTSEDGMGLRAGSLPIAGPARDWDPVCYIADLIVEGVPTTVLGYEEPNGDKILPCGGSREGFPFTAQQIENASAEQLQVMCEYCYESVCSGIGASDPRKCGDANLGGVDIGEAEDEAHIKEQVSSAYHCHLTMADDGACDFVHYNQHVSSRDYLMESGVVCGWERVIDLQITHCDCTREAGTANNCARQECLDMALAGVVCGNCGGCNEDRAYEAIFDFPHMPDPYEGSCGYAYHAKQEFGEDSTEFAEARRICAKGLFCRDNDNRDSGSCTFYCNLFGADDTERCAEENRRKLLSTDGEIPTSTLRGNPIFRRSAQFT